MSETLLYRAAATEANGIDVANGIARLSFSSEHPVLRRNDAKWGTYVEILSHSPGDLNCAILERGAPVMFDHEPSQVVGSVERGSFQIGSDRKARATIQIDREWRSYLGDIATHRAPNAVSVGYSPLSVVKREEGANGIPILTFAWMPEEISILTKGNPPADPRVGIGRSSHMKTSLDEILALALSGSRVTPGDDFSDVSLVETLNQVGRARHGRVREMFESTTRIAGNPVTNAVPFSVIAPRLTRDMQATVFPAGGAFVPTEMQAGIPLLFNRLVCRRLGAQVFTGFTGNPVFPRASTAALVSALGEIDPMLSNDLVTAANTLHPCRASAVMTFSKQLLDMSGPGIEEYFRSNIGDAITTTMDRLIIFGQGGNFEPLGIVNFPGAQSYLYSGQASHNALAAQKQALAASNIPEESYAFALSPSARGRWETIPKIAGFPTYLCENDRAANCPVLASNQIPANGPSILGAWRTLLIAIFGNGVDLTLDRFSKATSGEYVLSAHIWFSALPFYPQGFIVSADSAAQ